MKPNAGAAQKGERFAQNGLTPVFASRGGVQRQGKFIGQLGEPKRLAAVLPVLSLGVCPRDYSGVSWQGA